jgi:hypothetical protein
MSAPNYVIYTVLLSSIGIIAAILAGLRGAVSRAGWEEAQRVATLRTAAVLLSLWFVVALGLSWAEVLRRLARQARPRDCAPYIADQCVNPQSPKLERGVPRCNFV